MVVRTRGKVRFDYAKEIAVIRNSGQWMILLLGLVVLGILPLFIGWTGNSTWLTFINMTFIIIIAILGLNIITGMAGQISLGHAAFILVGGFVTGVLMTSYSWPFWAALPASAVITALTGMIIGAPSIRLKGFYLAMATFAFYFVAQFIERNLDITGNSFGIIGIPAPTIGSFKIDTDIKWYFVILIFMLVFIYFSVNLTRSRLGRAFFAVRDNENTAASLGVQPYSTKLRAFFLGSLFAGVAGSLMAASITVIRSDQLTLWDSIWYLGMIVIGGGGSTAGAIMGVIFLRLIDQILRQIGISGLVNFMNNNTWVNVTYAINGIAILLFISLQPYGLMSLWKKLRAKYKRWPFGY